MIAYDEVPIDRAIARVLIAIAIATRSIVCGVERFVRRREVVSRLRVRGHT